MKFEKIKLEPGSVVVFLGTMNAMPMMYALELRRMGCDVIYFVDVSSSNTLSRPENHFPSIGYPYPDWVVECVLPSEVFVPIFPKLFAEFYKKKIREITEKPVACFVLSGLFSSMAPYLPETAKKVGLPHGSDLDSWANVEDVDFLIKNYKNNSKFRYLPDFLAGVIIKKIVLAQYAGYKKSVAAVYFPSNFNSSGDKVLKKLANDGVAHVPRYDISFEPLSGQPRNFKKNGAKVEIFSGVRFLFETFPDGNSDYNKGNDKIIEGIAKYFRRNENIHVNFVEKGVDVIPAKRMCHDLGIDAVVTWHKEMPFKELLKLYENADICFDQVGAHWIGAVGAYAMYLGKPLIANAGPAVTSEVWPENHPVCSATTGDEVFDWLVKLEDEEFLERISSESKVFVEKYMGPGKVLNALFDIQMNI